MDMAAPRELLGGRGPGPPQKFGNMSYFVGQLLSRKQVSQTIWGEPPQVERINQHRKTNLLLHRFYFVFQV